MTLKELIDKVESRYGDIYFYIEGVSEEDGREYIKFSNRNDLDYISIVVYLDDLTE